MRTDRLRNLIVLAFGLVTLAGLSGGGEALAQKKGSGGTPPTPAPGTIYYSNGNGLYSSMNGDGTGKVQSMGGVPTYQKHGNSRWFLQHQAIGNAYHWSAVNAAGSAVLLTNDPNLRWNGHPASWTKDDSAFSICCTYETPLEWVGQLIVIPVTWTNGVPSAGPPTVVLELRRSVFDEWGEYSWLGFDEVSLGRHDWSPVGDEVALTHWYWGMGWVLEVVRFTATGLESRQLLTSSQNPVWSPDGSRIAFNRLEQSGFQDIMDIRTIKPDGTDIVRLTSYIPGKGYNGTGQALPTWSPDGAFLAYSERVTTSSRSTYNIRRVPAAGGGSVSLTSDNNSFTPYWR